MQPLELGGDNADILAALRHLELVDALDGHGVGEGVGVRTDSADALDQHDGLYRVALGAELFDAAVVIADEDLGVLYDLALGVELGVYRLLQRGMVGPYGNDIAHSSLTSFFSPSSSSRLSTSSESGVTSMCPLPAVSSMFSGRKRRFEVSRPSKLMPSSS